MTLATFAAQLLLLALLCAVSAPAVTARTRSFAVYGAPHRSATMFFQGMTQSYSLACARPGRTSTGEGVYNNGADIRILQSFIGTSWTYDYFQVGIQGGEKGIIVDLGTEDEINSRFVPDVQQAAGNAYASIQLRSRYQLDSTKVQNLTTTVPDLLLTVVQGYGSSYREQQYINKYYFMRDTAQQLALFQSPPGTNSDMAKIQQGHVYLLSISDYGELKFVGKFIVLDYVPQRSVSIEFQNLFIVPDSSAGRSCDQWDPIAPSDHNLRNIPVLVTLLIIFLSLTAGAVCVLCAMHCGLSCCVCAVCRRRRKETCCGKQCQANSTMPTSAIPYQAVIAAPAAAASYGSVKVVQPAAQPFGQVPAHVASYPAPAPTQYPGIYPAPMATGYQVNDRAPLLGSGPEHPAYQL